MSTARSDPPLLALVVPCFNEEEIIADTIRILSGKLAEWRDAGLISKGSFCCMVDDGSDDRTWELLASSAEPIACLKLAFNVGHQRALLAGLSYAADKADCCVSLDADLQDDVDVIPQMLEHYAQGKDIVYGIRAQRTSDSPFKRLPAASFYWLAHKLGIAGTPNHADFRLMSRRALLAISQFRERQLYLRGLIPMLKLPSAKVFYERKKRMGGTAKYTFWKSLGLALDGITSFSIVPLRFITLLGLVISVFSGVLALRFVLLHASGNTVPGWSSLIVSLYLLGGLIMLSLGVMGEYIAKILLESKQRPNYIIEQAKSLSSPD